MSDNRAPAPRLVIVRATADEAVGAARKVGGLTVLERALKQLTGQGLSVVLASDGSCRLPRRLPAGVEVRVVAGPAAVHTLRAELGDPPVVPADEVRPTNQPDGQGGLRVVDRATARRAEDAIFAELLRGDLGPVARHLNKRLSFLITRYVLCHLPITPNLVTVLGAAIALVGCAAMTEGRYQTTLAGFVLVQLQSVLDGCDGELARVRFQRSAIGEWLDTVVDDLLNIAILVSVAVGLWRAHATRLPLWLALLGGVLFGVYYAIVYRQLIRQGEGGDFMKVRWWFLRGASLATKYTRTTGIRWVLWVLGRRDTFIVGCLLLAALDLPWAILIWFLVMAVLSFVVGVGQIVNSAKSA